MGNCMTSANDEHMETPQKSTSKSLGPEQASLVVEETTPSMKMGSTALAALTDNEKVAAEWFSCFTSKDALQKIQANASEDCLVVFAEGDFQMPLDQFITDVNVCYDSFPDLKLTYDLIKEVSPGKVVLKNVLAAGTHTGVPYGFGPYPAVPAANVKVVDPPLEATLIIENGKVVQYICDSLGELSGPPNFYTQIGGLII